MIIAINMECIAKLCIAIKGYVNLSHARCIAVSYKL